MSVYDIIIIGGGPAGYTAALYATRAGFSTLLIEKMSAGGQLALTGMVDNYPGFEEGVDGFTLGMKMQSSAERFGAKTEYAEVTELDLNGNIKNGSYTSSPVAFRYVFVPGVFDATVTAQLEYLPLKNKGSFKCDNEEINKLWDVCAYTMLLNSREAFFDGIKRDRWVWSGDAYQSFFVNYYLANDREIVKRTIRMLRGADPIFKHINTICDYTFLWLCGIWEYYIYSGDKEFLEDIYPEMLDMWKFISGRLSADGLYERKPDDWVFIDWSTFDSNGPMCAEQMLLCRACECISLCAKELNDNDTENKFKKHHLYEKQDFYG